MSGQETAAQAMERELAAFAALLRAKGYRRDLFTLVMDDLLMTEFKGSLETCLQGFKAAYMESKEAEKNCRLYAHAYFRGETDNIFCVFRLQYEKTFGLRAGSIRFDDARSGQSRGFRCHNNEQIPEARNLARLFPRKKTLWQRLGGKGRGL